MKIGRGTVNASQPHLQLSSLLVFLKLFSSADNTIIRYILWCNIISCLYILYFWYVFDFDLLYCFVQFVSTVMLPIPCSEVTAGVSIGLQQSSPTRSEKCSQWVLRNLFLCFLIEISYFQDWKLGMRSYWL